jgi:hypothetical protein
MAVVWTTYGGLMALDAGAQLAAASAARLAASTDKGVDRAYKALQKAAYPPDPRCEAQPNGREEDHRRH